LSTSCVIGYESWPTHIARKASLAYAPRSSSCVAHTSAVELDDSSYVRADRRERDAFVDEVLAGIGIPILHVRWHCRYDSHILTAQIATRIRMAAVSTAPQLPPKHAQPTLPMPPIATPAAAQLPAVPYSPAKATASATPHMSASVVAPAPVVATRRSCGQCQAERWPFVLRWRTGIVIYMVLALCEG
jgi:hypothetical protein